jgi:hypothetical protein
MDELSGLELEESDRYAHFPPSYPQESSASLHDRIFVQNGNMHNSLKAMKVSAEGGFTVEWGNPGGPSISGYVSGSASDDKGNKTEVKVEVNDDGSGKATVSASHDEDNNSDTGK